jgi:peptide/nickel transport system permease protein
MTGIRALSWILCAAIIVALCALLERAARRASDDSGPWRSALARFRRNRLAVVALWIVIAACVVAALAPWLVAYSPTATPDIVTLKNLPPSATHLLGTDFASRDVFSRLLYGARVSLSIALLAILLSATVGTLYGATAGYYGGRIDAIMMRIIDAALSIPRILLLITLLVLWGALPITSLIVVLGFTGWFGVSRLVRAEVISLKERDMVVAARALGARDREIIFRHILPNVLSPVVVAATLGIANVIVIEAGLSYLGIGVRPPLPSWGNMIQDGVSQIASVWWVSLFPGLAIVATVMAFNIIGDGLRDALDPRQLDG